MRGENKAERRNVRFFLRSLRLRLSPARVRMMIRASLRRSAEMFRMEGAIKSRRYGPIMIPTISIPRRGGSLILEQIDPSSRALRQMIAREVRKSMESPYLQGGGPFVQMTRKGVSASIILFREKNTRAFRECRKDLQTR